MEGGVVIPRWCLTITVSDRKSGLVEAVLHVPDFAFYAITSFLALSVNL